MNHRLGSARVAVSAAGCIFLASTKLAAHYTLLANPRRGFIMFIERVIPRAAGFRDRLRSLSSPPRALRAG